MNIQTCMITRRHVLCHGRRMLMIGLGCLAPFAITARGNESSTDATWPQWRGPFRNGMVDGDAWSDRIAEESLKELWRVDLGPGYSGPLVVGDRIFVAETQDESREVVRALDRDNGRELWRAEWDGAMKVPFFARSNGDWIRATPAYADGRLYVAGMRDVLVCLDAATGQELWRIDFAKKYQVPLPAFGFVCSPLVVDDHVYVQAAHSFVKVHAQTGEIVWRTLNEAGGMNDSAFSSPIMATLSGRRQLLVQTRTDLAAVDPQSGDVLWEEEVPAFRGMNILTPTVVGDRVFTSSYGGKSLLFAVADTDGQQTPTEFWQNKAQGYMSSPVVIGNHIYLHLRNQRFTCLDANSGETRWTTTPYGKYWSLVANGDRILALDERGELYLIRAHPEKFELLDSRQLGAQETWAHLAVAGNSVVVRALRSVIHFQLDTNRVVVPQP